jgi:hypothetical protein
MEACRFYPFKTFLFLISTNMPFKTRLMNPWRSFLITFLAIVFLGCGNKHKAQLDRPKLVIGIVVDQMRWDYLFRYYNRFGEDGFKRLLITDFLAMKSCLITFRLI